MLNQRAVDVHRASYRKKRKLTPHLSLPSGTKSVSELVKHLPLLFDGKSQGGGLHFC